MLGAGRAVVSYKGPDFSSSDEALSVGMEGVMGYFSTTSNIEISSRLPFSSRGARHLWRSWTALLSVPGDVLDCMAHCWRAWASTPVSSHHFTQKFWQPWNGRGRKSPCLSTSRQGGALHQPCFSTWAMGSMKAAACLLARDRTWMSLRGLASWWWMTQNSHHQSGIFLLFLM